MIKNFTFEHDDHSPFGTDEVVYLTEYHSLIISIIFFIIGLFGNTLILIGNGYILRHSHDGEKRTFENFLLEISCFDLIVLLYHLINSIIRFKALNENYPDAMIGLVNISTVSCKLVTYIVRVSTLMSHWLIILLLLNRLCLIYKNFYRFITIVNAKYAVVGLVFLFTLFNVPSIELMSHSESLHNLTHNISSSHYCLINIDMIDLHESVYSNAVIINVFFYSIVGLILPTIIIFILSIFIYSKGKTVWHELNSHNSQRDNVCVKSDSPLIEYLHTYNSSFTFGFVFVFLSLPSKFFRLFVLLTTKHIAKIYFSMQTIGYAFELSLYSYKFLIFFFTNSRFRSALKYILNKRDHRRRHHSKMSFSNNKNQRMNISRSQENVPFETLCKHLQINEYEPSINTYRTDLSTGLFSHRSSFKTRSSVSSRRTKEDEISL